MDKMIANDPFYGLPIKLTVFEDDSASYVHAISHQVKQAHIDRENNCICIPLEDLQTDTSITATTAARYLHVSRMRITQLCNEGKVHSAMIGSSLFVNKADVLQYANQDRTPGRKEQ